MLHTRRPWSITFFLLCTLVPIGDAKSEQAYSRLSSTQIHDASTCPSQSINYITQTLPRQCLTSSWSVQSALRSSNYTNVSTSSNINEITSIAGQPTSVSEGSSLSSTTTISATTRPSAVVSVKSTVSVVESKRSIVTLLSPNNDETSSHESPRLEYDNEADPLSDEFSFLSFEEWKSRMLEKAGQSSDHVGTPRHASGRSEFQSRPGTLNNALDSLGEDAEIELDFISFASPHTKIDPVRRSETKNSEKKGDMDEELASKGEHLSIKSKDAGKTCKERFNYASFDCAATVLKTNPECKGSTAVLVENKDSYMLNECSAKNKFFIVELCNDILIDTIVLGNFEFFSSTFRTFRVSVSDRYPVKLDKWRELGTFEARNTREVQAFLVENPLIWARYMRIEFLTHYGNEYYCPASLLRVHGKTMMDDYRHDVKAARGEEDIDDDVSEMDNDVRKSETAIISTEVHQHPTLSGTASQASTLPNTTISTAASKVNISAVSGDAREVPSKPTNVSSWFTYKNLLYEQQQLLSSNCAIGKSSCHLEFTEVLGTLKPVLSSTTSNFLISSGVALTGSDTTSKVSAQKPTVTVSLPPSGMSVPGTIPSQRASNNKKNQSSTSATPVSTNASADYTSQVNIKSSYQPPAPSPTTQESFFKSIHKRLQLLESNSTLSLQYIEEQSRILREAFTKVEKRQLSKTTTFLDSLNTTVLNELREFRHQYDQIWQSTVLELSAQREQSQREVIALSARLSILADEILFQKRMAIVQFLLIVLCLGLVIFSRTAPSNPTYLELQSTIQNMVSKPSTRLSRYLHLDSPPGSPSRPASRYGFFSRTMNHIRSPSNDSTLLSDDKKSASGEYSPPTPISSPSDDDREESASPEASLSLRRTVSSPAVPIAQREDEDQDIGNDAENMDDGMTEKSDDEERLPFTKHLDVSNDDNGDDEINNRRSRVAIKVNVL